MLDRIWISSCLLLAGCPSYTPDTVTTGQGQQDGTTQVGTTPVPTVDKPFDGLPALSGNRTIIALPTLTNGEKGQERAVVFGTLGDTEQEGKPFDVPLFSPEAAVAELGQMFRALNYASLPWVMTPDDPPLPMTITVDGNELYFAGDMNAQVTVQVAAGGKIVGGDMFQVPGESQTSPERIIAIGATIVWTAANRGFAYIRYDIHDRAARDSEWRVVTLTK